MSAAADMRILVDRTDSPLLLTFSLCMCLRTYTYILYHRLVFHAILAAAIARTSPLSLSLAVCTYHSLSVSVSACKPACPAGS